MTDENIKTFKSSVLASHHKIMDDEPNLDEQSAQIKREAASMALPEMEFADEQQGVMPPAKIPGWITSGFALVAVLLISVVVLRKDPNATMGIKGNTNAWFDIERDGTILSEFPGAGITAGDRLRIQVVSPAESDAYLTIFSESTDSFFSSEDILANKLSLAAGERATFDQELVFDANNEGETAAVAVCPSGTRFSMRVFSGTRCQIFRQPLRKKGAN